MSGFWSFIQKNVVKDYEPDFLLESYNKKSLVHKSIVCLISPVIRQKILESPNIERYQIRCSNNHVFDLFVNSMYDGFIPKSIEYDFLLQLFELYIDYEIDPLANKCHKKLLYRLNSVTIQQAKSWIKNAKLIPRYSKSKFFHKFIEDIQLYENSTLGLDSLECNAISVLISLGNK